MRGDLIGDVPSGRTGLAAYGERMAEAGGVLLLDASPATGTRVRACLPLAADADGHAP